MISQNLIDSQSIALYLGSSEILFGRNVTVRGTGVYYLPKGVLPIQKYNILLYNKNIHHDMASTKMLNDAK